MLAEQPDSRSCKKISYEYNVIPNWEIADREAPMGM
jgi:hypothetical protein